jgi:midasin (ATPase involved in ribosome maturation)
MNFKEKPITERRKLLRNYPLLISGPPNSGKTAAIETLPDEDKSRTVFFDLEGKGLVEDYEDQ